MNVNWIITAFVIVDTTFTTLEHQSDVRAGVPDSEIITVALVAAKYFANNHKLTLSIMQQLHYLSGTISHSRFNRRLHALRDWMEFFPEYLGEIFSKNTIYIIDSMPMPVCHRARAKRCTKVRGKYFSGWCAAKQERYFGWKLHLIYDIHGIPIRFMMLPARPTILLRLMDSPAQCHLGQLSSVTLAIYVKRRNISLTQIAECN